MIKRNKIGTEMYRQIGMGRLERGTDKNGTGMYGEREGETEENGVRKFGYIKHEDRR